MFVDRKFLSCLILHQKREPFDFLLDIVKHFCEEHGISMKTFGEIKSRLVANGSIPDMLVNDLDEDTFTMMMGLVEVNLGQQSA